MGNVWRAEELLKWAFSGESQKVQSFVEDFILTDYGVKSCRAFIRKASDIKPNMPQITINEKLEKFNRFIDFWIRPLKNIEAFRIKF